MGTVIVLSPIICQPVLAGVINFVFSGLWHNQYTIKIIFDTNNYIIESKVKKWEAVKYKQFSKFPGMIFKNYLNEINNITFTLLYDFKIHVASYQNF